MRIWPRTECPNCGALPGEMCRTRNGKGGKATRPHRSRPIGPLGGVSKPITRQIDTLR